MYFLGIPATTPDSIPTSSLPRMILKKPGDSETEFMMALHRQIAATTYPCLPSQCSKSWPLSSKGSPPPLPSQGFVWHDHPACCHQCAYIHLWRERERERERERLSEWQKQYNCTMGCKSRQVGGLNYC
jgi:hypothetical protein